MRTWAHWTAKTVMLTAAFAAAGAGFTDTASAVSGGGGGSTSGLDSPLRRNQVSTLVSVSRQCARERRRRARTDSLTILREQHFSPQ